MSNYASLNVIDELRRIPGVGDAQNFGAKDYSIRVWMRPDRMAQLGLTPADVAAAIREQNAQFAAGRVGQAPTGDPVDFTFSVTTHGPARRSRAVRRDHPAHDAGRRASSG